MTETRLRIALQKGGRLNQGSLELLRQCGLKVSSSKSMLFSHGENLPIDLLFVRDDDIPMMVMDKVCDLGVVGENVLFEKLTRQQVSNDIEIIKKLGFGFCRLSLAVPKEKPLQDINEIRGQRIATSYPNILSNFLTEQGLSAQIIEFAGSVELAPYFGIADLICDLVSSGDTLSRNNLTEAVQILSSEAVLLQQPSLSAEKQALVQLLLRRLSGVLQVQDSKYIMFHAPKKSLDNIGKLLPGSESPTILSLEGDKNKVAVHVVSHEGVFWETMEQLKDAGASSILVMPIEKMMQ